MTEDEIRDLFREMRETPVPADTMVRVRSRLEGRMRRRGWWKPPAWVAAATVLLVALMFRPAPVSQNLVREKVVAHRADPPRMSPDEMPRPAVRHSIHSVHRTIHSPKPAVPIVIEIETSDPDVVIRLIGE